MISIIIPTKNEPLLERTIDDIKENARTDIEILTEEDSGIGQRALMNKLAKQAKYDYVMKTDAHCSFGPAFDKILLDTIDDDMVLMPLLYPLNPEHWTINHHNPMSNYVFDTDLVMHFGEHNPKETLTRSMCVQGSCFMTKIANYFDWELADESLNWGGQASEIGIKTYLNGGRCMTTKDTYYGHVFRHFDEDFPYERDHKEIAEGKKALQKLKTKAIAGLVEEFDYPVDWTPEKVSDLV